MYDFTIRCDSYNIHINCIVRFMSTYDTSVRYENFYTRYDMYCVSYDTDNYAHMYS